MEKRVVDAWVLAESDPSLTEKAARFAHKATSIYPRNARIQFFTARLDAQCGRHREAARRLELALQIEPEYDDARRELNQLRQSMNTPAQTGFRLKDWFSRRERE